MPIIIDSISTGTNIHLLMADSKGKSIPQWQRQEPLSATGSSVPDQATSTPPAATGEAYTTLREELLQQGTEWLQHEDIRDAPRERKMLFLEKKGLSQPEIHRLMEASHSNSPEHAPVTSHAEPASSGSKPSIPQETSSIPPIITYPEFLIHSHRSQPLITRSRLLSALYVSSATAAAIYGTSKYLLNPMLESLQVARQSLFQTATSNLDTLNKKLEGVVTTIPSLAIQLRNHERSLEDGFDNEDSGSEISDPTELFHRDTGTQTSPPISPSTSSASLTYLDPTSNTPVSTHTIRLKTLSASLSSVLSSHSSAAEEDDAVIQGFGDLRDYLLDITYGRVPGSSKGEVARTGGEDEISKVKAEIRGFKGVLLSAKSFPGTGITRLKVVAS
ncbi:hypothetical protein MMC13_000696 [Lambiella insularis]|nr:hypothetical protein [Lambiella insularis]